MKVLVAQLCPTLCDPMDYSPSGSSVHGILWARILEGVAMPSARGSSWPRDFSGDSDGQESACNVADSGSIPESGRFLPRKTHGERTLAGYNAWGCRVGHGWATNTLDVPCHVLNHSVVSDSSGPHELQPTRLFCPWDFPGKSTGVGCHCLLWKKAMVFHKILIILLSQKHGRDF